MSKEMEVLLSVARDVAAVRRDLAALRNGLAQQGFAVGKDPEALRVDASWNPPVLKRLGDMVTILAKSDPATSAAFQEIGFDTERDIATDPTRDQQPDRDARTDPDPAPKDDKSWWWPFDDADMTAADAKADPKLPDTRDDSDDQTPRPDTARDSLT